MLQERGMTFGELQDIIVSSFRMENPASEAGARMHILHEVKELLRRGVICIEGNYNEGVLTSFKDENGESINKNV